MDPTCELEKLYESGIQFTLQPDAGCGFLVGYGDYLHRAENTAVLPTFERAVGWLLEQVHAPASDRAIGRSSGPSAAGRLEDLPAPVAIDLQLRQPALAVLRRRLL